MTPTITSQILNALCLRPRLFVLHLFPKALPLDLVQKCKV